MTTSDVRIGQPYVVRIEDRGLCIALASGPADGDEVPMMLRQLLSGHSFWNRRTRKVRLEDVRRVATEREVVLGMAL